MTSKQEPRTNGPKLKPCPFCGGDAYFDRLGTPRVSAIVACGDCGCRMESSDEGENSGRTWNQREPAHPPEATGLQCEKDGVCALVSRNDDEWHCTACNGDFVRKQPVEPAPVEATGLQDKIARAYGYLWHVNNSGVGFQFSPEKAAHMARRVLRDTLTHEQRGNAINMAATELFEILRNEGNE